MRVLLPVAFCGVVCAAALAQSKAPVKPQPARADAPKAGTTADDAPQIPATRPVFEKQAAIPGAPLSNAYYQPIACTPDGIPVVVYPTPFTPSAGHPITGADFMPGIYSFDPKGSHGFAVSTAPGLYDVWYRSYFVGPSTVYIEVHATDDNTQVTRQMHTPSEDISQIIYSGKHREYVLEFDMQGNFKKAVAAPDRYQIERMGALSDGSFVALAYDEVNRAPILVLLDSDLQMLRPLEIPEEMANDPALVKGETGGNFNVAMAMTRLSGWQFATARGSVVLYQAHTSAPVVEIGPGGVEREVPLQAPKGYELETVIAANDRWLMKFRRASLPETGAYDARPQSGNVVLYGIDPNDGSLRRRIELPPSDKEHASPFLACEEDGTLVGFLPEAKQMVRYTADIGH